LGARGFQRLVECPLGVDLELFRPGPERFTDLRRPVFTYVGRLAVEKDLPAFLRLPLPGTKLVVGDGPERARLERALPQARFVGAKRERNSRVTTSDPTCSSSPAGRRPSAWSCSKRWRAACPWRRFRCAVRWTWCRTLRRACSTRISAARRSRRCSSAGRA